MFEPSRFGKYELVRRISQGGMAEVFEAKVRTLPGFEKIVAIKRMLPELAEDAEFVEMFIDEAKLCSVLSHANVCQTFELGCVDGSYFIAMEHVSGKNLRQIERRLSARASSMTPEMAAYIALKVCEGLDYAHRKTDASGPSLGIVHRDVSPTNILISDAGEVKIIDFGVAKARGRSLRTRGGVLKGKLAYMSPEQARGLPLDRRSDVFAVGAVLYEMVTGKRLFAGESDADTLERVRNAAIPPFWDLACEVPASLEQILLRALAKNVDERYQWATEMRDDLQAFLLTREPGFEAEQLSDWMARHAQDPDVDSDAIAIAAERTQVSEPPCEETPRTALFRGGSAQPAPAAPPPPSSLAIPRRSVTNHTPPHVGQLVERRTTPSSHLPQTRETLFAIGALVLLVAAYPAGRYYVDHASGTIVIASTGGTIVTVDGKPKGQVGAAGALMLKDVAPGEHEVTLTESGGKISRRTLTTAAGALSVVAPAAQVASKRLRVELLTEGTRVYADGKALGDENMTTISTTRTITLSADRPHEIRVTKEQTADQRFLITLETGDEPPR